MEPDLPGHQPRSLLGALRSSMESNRLGIALEQALVHHDELSKTYECDTIGERTKANEVLGSSLDNRKLVKALDDILGISNTNTQTETLTSTWPQVKKILPIVNK